MQQKCVAILLVWHPNMIQQFVDQGETISTSTDRLTSFSYSSVSFTCRSGLGQIISKSVTSNAADFLFCCQHYKCFAFKKCPLSSQPGSGDSVFTVELAKRLKETLSLSALKTPVHIFFFTMISWLSEIKCSRNMFYRMLFCHFLKFCSYFVTEICGRITNSFVLNL